MWLRSRLRAIFMSFVLMGGVFSGVAMRPEDIEALLNTHTRIQIEHSVRKEEEDEEE